jgi:hypothetical protein
MHLSILPTLLLLATTASARCFPTSERQEAWKDKNDAKNAVKSTCKLLIGEFDLGEQKMYCFNGSRGQRYNFVALMDQNPDQRRRYRLEEEECFDRFYTNIDSCERGGQTNNKFMLFT